MFNSGDILDGYQLMRVIGEGGFGSVWLVRACTTGELRALKFLPAQNQDRLQRELDALIRYRAGIGKCPSAHLLPIEHVNRHELGLFYTMPLADGLREMPPEHPEWVPKTLANFMEARRNLWFSSSEIRSIILDLIRGVSVLGDLGVVHRDIKPENVIFLSGRAALADISLLGEDSLLATRRGTPGYVAPSWYLESDGSPDMWGIAVTLYVLLTGNEPDKITRSSLHNQPPGGADSLSPDERAEWQRLYQVVLRATREEPLERYLSIAHMASAISAVGGHRPSPPLPDGEMHHPVPRRKSRGWSLLLIGAGGFWRDFKSGQFGICRTGKLNPGERHRAT